MFWLPEWLLWLLLIGLLAVAAEIGYRVARRVGHADDPHQDSHTTMVQGALLGLLALLLGFTFSLSSARFDQRRELVVDEANAIMTTYLRAKLLPEPRHTAVAGLLRQYVDVRTAVFDPGQTERDVDAAIRRSIELHGLLWAQTAGLDREASTAVTTVFLQSLNEVIDLHDKRVAARRNHVPELVLDLLFVVATVSVTFVGYGAGLGRRRNLLGAVSIIILVSTVIVMIVDLDRPRRGLIHVTQQPMLDVRAQIR